jgi:hypothetical protein
MSLISIILAVSFLIISWVSSAVIFYKISDRLKGKVWIIGIIGLISFIGIFWLVAIYTTINVVLPLATFVLPWWLNYMYYLTKAKATKERMSKNVEI